MKIEGYSVFMNSTYFSMTGSSSSIGSEGRGSLDTSTGVVESAKIDEESMKKSYDEMSQKLATALLSNISSSSRSVVGDRVEIEITYMEAQELNFQTKAYIQAEGREMGLSLDVSLSRSFVSKTSLSMSAYAVQDPLIISLGSSSMPTLSTDKFAFDIDSDGESEQISKLGLNSAFLALDKNSNSFIDNGSELFGTKSGDGFADLALYDDDKNGWIDENDTIFDKLRIWQKTEREDKLLALGEVGIGAIFLGSAHTPFSLKSSINDTLGEMRKSGIVLFESGRAGVISQIDLAVSEPTKESLAKLDDAKKANSFKNLTQTYSDEKESPEGTLEKLQKRLRVLEDKLLNASDNEKPTIQAQIGIIYTQMMSMIERG